MRERNREREREESQEQNAHKQKTVANGVGWPPSKHSLHSIIAPLPNGFSGSGTDF